MGFLKSTVVLALSTIALLFVPGGKAQTGEATGRTIQVPIQYENPKSGRAPLSLEFAAPYDKNKPVILVIADGQQFYVRRGAMKALQESTFGSAFNVVGIIPRGRTPEFIRASLDQSGRPDWLKAWHIFNSSQWIEDIESVRKAIVGEKGTVYLYGRSGGAYLVHQYLAKHSDHATKAFTQSAVNPFIARDLGIGLDRFWSELGIQDPKLQGELLTALRVHPQERQAILMTLQRQHFFVSPEKISEARADLIHALANGNLEHYWRARKEYEVDSVIEMSESSDIIPQNVRVLELLYPSGAFNELAKGRIYPLVETQRYFIKPLLELLESKQINLPAFDFTALHRCSTQLFLLAGRYDEAVDYRTSIALANAYPDHELFIADDNHVFSGLSSSGTSKQIIEAFFGFGLHSPQLASTLQNAARFRWKEE